MATSPSPLFLGLPAELRNRIYSYVLGPSQHIIVSPPEKKISQYPAITRISRQIRQEVLPIFYALSTVEFKFTSVPTHINAEVAKAARHWLKKVPRDLIKHLMALSLTLTIKTRSNWGVMCAIRLTFKTEERLRVDPPLDLTLSSKFMLHNHIADVKAECDLLGLEDNKAIILALVSNEAIWNWGVLQVT